MPRHKIFQNLLIMTSACLMVSCTLKDHSDIKPVPSLNFDYLEPYNVDNGRATITQTFTPDLMTMKVTKEFGESPADLVRRYAQSRFETNAPRQSLVINIKEASLSKITSLTDPLMFMTGLSKDIYVLKIFLELFPVSMEGNKTNPHTVYYEQQLTMSENVTLAARENAQFEFYEKTINDIDKAISDIVLNKL